VGLAWRWSNVSNVLFRHLCLPVQDASVLQAQHDELASDVFDGMCALGIESHRAAALADALSAAGVDPNPILTAVESEHLEAHAARMIASDA
jgi:hypothetical protein